MSLTNTFETSTLTWLFTTSSPSPARPTSWFIGLFTAAPGEAGGGTEVSGNGYARQSATLTVAGNQASNSVAVEFPAATASWGTITHAAVFDASTSGNMIAYMTLVESGVPTPKVIANTDILRFPISQLTFTLD